MAYPLRLAGRIWAIASHIYTGIGVGGLFWKLAFGSGGGVGGGLMAALSNLHPALIFFSILGGSAIGVWLLNGLTWRKLTRQAATTAQAPEEARQVEVGSGELVQRHAFLSKLNGVAEQLAGITQGAYVNSVTTIHSELCGENSVKPLLQDKLSAQGALLFKEHCIDLALRAAEHETEVNTLSTTTLTDEEVRLAANRTRDLVMEYRRRVQDFQDFLEGLLEKARSLKDVRVRTVWNSAPWSVKIHRHLADDYDELMRLVKDLRRETKRELQSHLPEDFHITNFPRAPLVS